MKTKQRIGILTGGGDAPGLNAVIRAVAKAATLEHGWEVLGIRDGFDGLLDGRSTIALTPEVVRGILPLGGTILGAANRGNPFARQAVVDGETVVYDASDETVARLDALGLDGLVVAGGDGTMHIVNELLAKGCPIIGVPKTIDNDLGGTDVTFGFDTAVNTATGAVDKLHTTAEAHHRVMVVEVMGRDAGWIGLYAGLGGGADAILIPEIPYDLDVVCAKIARRRAGGRYFSIVVVSEGARPVDGDQVFRQDDTSKARLGGISHQIADQIARRLEVETRATILGHLQRGGSPTPFDRMLATRLGGAAVRLAAAGRYGRMVSLQGAAITSVPVAEAVAELKRVDPAGDTVQTARDLGIVFG
jgi:ATP-dependent phosphofructokinase / diphosphate-dependent phosphofructokinase